MKNAIFAIFLILLSVFSLFSQDFILADTKEIFDDFVYISSFYPRTEGSEGEQKVISYIKNKLEYLNVEVKETDFYGMKNGHSFSSSLEVFIEGEKEEEILFIVPLNHPEKNKVYSDGSINIAIALGLIESLLYRSYPLNIRFLFLGSEYGDEELYPIGTNYFLDEFYPENPVFVLYLNFEKIPSRIIVKQGGKGVIAPYWLINRTISALDKGNLFYLLRGNENQVYRLGISDETSFIDPYLQRGYPTIGFEGTYEDETNSEEWLISFFQFMNEFLVLNSGGFTEEWDRHYLFFQVLYNYLIIDEPTYIIILISILSIAMLYPLFAVKRFKKYLRTIRHNFWALPVFYGIIFGFLLVGTFLLEGILLLKKFPTLWEYSPGLFFLFKISAVLFLFALSFKLFRKLKFPVKGSFYSASALFFQLINIFIFAFFNLSLSYYAVWAFLFTFLFTLFPQKPVKIIFLILSTFLIIKGVYDVLTIPALQVCRVLLLSRFTGNLLITFNLLPFILLIIRIRLLLRHPDKKIQRVERILADAILGAAASVLFIYLILFNPYKEKMIQPVYLTEQIDMAAESRSLTITSPAPIGRVNLLSDPYNREIISDLREITIDEEEIPDIIDIIYKSKLFLDRKNINLLLTAEGIPSKVRVFLESSEDIIIFDSNFPFSLSPESDSAEIFIGTNPPVPLNIIFTLPGDFTGYITAHVIYKTSPYPLELTGDNIEIFKKIIIKQKISIVDTNTAMN